MAPIERFLEGPGAAAEVDLTEILTVLQRFSVAVLGNVKLFTNIGNYVRESIKKRTVERGRGPSGPWPPPYNLYSPRYEEFREEQGYPIDQVYLDYTGSMWGALTQEATEAMVRVFFAPRMAKAVRVKAVKSKTTGRKKERRTIQPKVTDAEKAFHLHQDRPFFLLSQEQIDFITERVTDALDMAMGGRSWQS